MSQRTGPITEIYPATTIPGTSAVAMTVFQAKGNSLKLLITTTGGGCGSLTFTAEEAIGSSATYADVIDRDSVWSMVSTVPNAAGTYSLDMEGLHLIPGNYYRMSYTAATAAGTLAVSTNGWEDPKGGGVSVSVGDIAVDIGDLGDAVTVGGALGTGPASIGSGYKSYIDTSFVTGDSPATVDVNTDLGRNGNQGYLSNDGNGDLSIKISESGAVSTEDAIVIKGGEVFSLDGMNADQIQITWVADTAYRILIK